MDVIAQRVDLSLKAHAVYAMAVQIGWVQPERGVIPSQFFGFTEQPAVLLRERFFRHGVPSI